MHWCGCGSPVRIQTPIVQTIANPVTDWTIQVRVTKIGGVYNWRLYTWDKKKTVLSLLVEKIKQAEKCRLLKTSIFWDIIPYSPLELDRRLGGTCRLHLQGRRISRAHTCLMQISCSAYSSTLKMEATCSSETSADFQTDYKASYPRRWYSS
jgi:hypothetical protein